MGTTQKIENEIVQATKPKRRRYRVGDHDFVAPDGGWGWLVVAACGFSNLSIFPMYQQFGLLFREKFERLGISNTETTTIINLNSAFNSCVGLLNGPVFRNFSYRQVALFGATLVATSLFLSTFCESFWTYLIFYAACYGSGIGITQSSNALALNTYFKEKRRIATGLSWTTTGLGPIVWPYIITALMGIYGMEGTLLIFSAFACHAILCSLLLQPVHWHTKFRDEEAAIKKPLITISTQHSVEPPLSKSRKSKSLFSSQYLNKEDEEIHHGYEINDHGTPKMIGANDGWYSQKNSLSGSRISLASNKTQKSIKVTSDQNALPSKRASYQNLLEVRSERKRKKSTNKLTIEESACEDCPMEKAPHDLREEEKNLLPEKKDVIEYPNEKDVLKTAAKKLAEYKLTIEENKKGNVANGALDGGKNESQKTNEAAFNGGDDHNEKGNHTVDHKHKKYSLLQKIIIFFDLNLLKDPIYLNLMLGITLANFAEINFSILTPFVLKEFHFEKYQIATFMSLLGATDIAVRFFIPFIAGKIGWENKTFFLIGVLMMAFGRIILVHTQTYIASILVAITIGAGKGLRTIFIALVIPSYVPLERLPAAAGLQLATSGLLFLLLGPVVGWIRDMVNNYVVTLHILNIMTYITAISWTVEPFISGRRRKNKEVDETIKT